MRSNSESGWKLALALMLLGVGTVAHAAIHEATVTGGAIKGVEEHGVASFKGIPYAAPPVGRLRWRPPQPVVSWRSTRRADAFAHPCAQGGGARLRSSEDCLYLNVWTAAASRKERRPVMVWIPGGGFTMNGPTYPIFDGAQFARDGVVLVTIAYRLGPFGFLAHPELSRESGDGSGNYGIEDQVAALEWVKTNIEHFGGDPSRVAIFGESAGAMSVSLLIVSPVARGLFERAIAQSGAMFQPVHLLGEPGDARHPFEPFASLRTLALAERDGRAFLRELGAMTIQAARELPADRLIDAAQGSREFWPVLDGRVLPGDDYTLYRAGRFTDVPILIGSNADDGSSSAPPPSMTAADWVARVRAHFGPTAQAVLATYPHQSDAQARHSSRDISRDGEFGWAVWTWAKLQAQKAQHRAYVYYFDAHPASGSESVGSGHGAEIAYLFGTFGDLEDNSGVGRVRDRRALELSALMRRYWINFASRGDPNSDGLPFWPPFTVTDERVMFFDANASARGVPNLTRLKVLDDYFARRRGETDHPED